MTVNQKILVALLLFVTWAGFVYTGQTPVDEFIRSIRDALVALGAFQIANTKPKE